MECVPCPISNSMEFTPWLKVPDRFDDSGTQYWQLVQSSASGLIMLNPRPRNSEIAPHYEHVGYDPYLLRQDSHAVREKILLLARSLLLRWRANLVIKGSRKPSSQLSILEIGCSTGELLNFFHRKMGISLANLAGVEPHAASAAHARDSYGLRVTRSLHDGYARKFDRIVLWHTLEHIHAIAETLESTARLLAPEGQLVIALPNPVSFGAKYYRENWIAWDAPRHLYHFLPGTLEKLLVLHGFTIVSESAWMTDSLYNALYSGQLCCKRAGTPFNLARFVPSLLRGICGMGSSLLSLRSADGIVSHARALP